MSLITADPPGRTDRPGLPGREVTAGRPGHPVRPAHGARWLPRALIVAGLGMIPWLFVLATQLPGSTTAWHWPAAWVGLDGLEALGLLGTGLLLARRDGRYRLAAMATATLLLTDAWFDVLTSAPGREQLTAIAMAACPELPVAALCAVLAVRGWDRPPALTAQLPGPGGPSPLPPRRRQG